MSHRFLRIARWMTIVVLCALPAPLPAAEQASVAYVLDAGAKP
jgi:hypothetical protein